MPVCGLGVAGTRTELAGVEGWSGVRVARFDEAGEVHVFAGEFWVVGEINRESPGVGVCPSNDFMDVVRTVFLVSGAEIAVLPVVIRLNRDRFAA